MVSELPLAHFNYMVERAMNTPVSQPYDWQKMQTTISEKGDQ
jgi:hypothetical protein